MFGRKNVSLPGLSECLQTLPGLNPNSPGQRGGTWGAKKTPSGKHGYAGSRRPLLAPLGPAPARARTTQGAEARPGPARPYPAPSLGLRDSGPRSRVLDPSEKPDGLGC